MVRGLKGWIRTLSGPKKREPLASSEGKEKTSKCGDESARRRAGSSIFFYMR